MTGVYMGNINPFTAMYATVTRNSDQGVFQPEQAVSVTEALSMWTIWAARSIGESTLKGSLEIGKYADMVVLSDDIFAIAPDKIKDLKVVTTIVNGAIVYS
jgi:predicted amidohydrolase YtcJ